ncbi:MATE family efflux transporter [uncultured Methanobrevibacter sp.]|uniref:MATE family efflux transporter n=1 Tax=uncultured Methanobrevibacter sp. TaxID=253161 RepID=UPI0025CDDBA4|nr:MATE family efflux transporter [uncultured Methanobrevibacter sp.]
MNEEQNNNKYIDLISLPKKSFWRLCIPISIFLLFETFYSIADMFWVSQLSMFDALAVGASAPILLLISTFGNSIGQGTNSIMSRYIGSNDYESSYNSLIHGIIVSVITWIFILASISLLDDLLNLMNIVNNQIYILDYLNPLFICSIVFIFTNVFCETLQSEGNSKTPVLILVISNILNLILDPIFIFIFKMGMMGVAFASVISSLFGVLCFLYLYLNGKTKVPLSLKYFKFESHIFFEIFKVAIPNFIDDSISCVLAIFINSILIMEIGEMGIILYSISIKIRDLLRAPIKGMGRGLMSVTGHLFGAKKINELNEMYMYVLKYSLILSIVISILFFGLSEEVYASFLIFNMDTSIFYIALFGIILIMVYPFSYISSKMLNGFGKSYYALCFNILKYSSEIILMIVLVDILPDGACVLVGITVGEILFSIVYYLTLKILFKRFEENKDTLAVT